MPPSTPKLIIHHHVALMLCESPAFLEEALRELEHLSLSYQRIGARAIVASAKDLHLLQQSLNERGIYPRLVGQPAPLSDPYSGEHA